MGGYEYGLRKVRLYVERLEMPIKTILLELVIIFIILQRKF